MSSSRRVELTPIVTSSGGSFGAAAAVSPQMPTPLLGNWCDMTPYGFEGGTTPPVVAHPDQLVVGSGRPSAAQSPLSTRSITRQTTSAFQSYLEAEAAAAPDSDKSTVATAPTPLARTQTPPPPSQQQQQQQEVPTAPQQQQQQQQGRKSEFAQLLVITSPSAARSGAQQEGQNAADSAVSSNSGAGGGLTIPPIVTPMMPTPLLGNWCDLTPTLLNQVSAFARSIAAEEDLQQQAKHDPTTAGAQATSVPPQQQQAMPVQMAMPYVMPYMMPQPMLYQQPYNPHMLHHQTAAYQMMFAAPPQQPAPWPATSFPPFFPQQLQHHQHHAMQHHQFGPAAAHQVVAPAILAPPAVARATGAETGGMPPAPPFRFPPPPPPGQDVCKTFLRTGSTCDKYYAIVLRWYAKVAKSIPSPVYPNAPPCPARESFLYDFDAWVVQMALWWTLNFGGDKCTGRYNPPSSGRAPPGSSSTAGPAHAGGMQNPPPPPPPYGSDPAAQRGMFVPPAFRGGWAHTR